MKKKIQKLHVHARSISIDIRKKYISYTKLYLMYKKA